jgi:isopenicillin N synthase-like dioxygenase
MSADVVPIIDSGPFLAGDPEGRKSVPRAVARACEEIGFFTIVGHGVDPALIAAATGAARAFFDLPAPEKMAARSTAAAVSRSYRGIGNEGLAGTRADQTPRTSGSVPSRAADLARRLPRRPPARAALRRQCGRRRRPRSGRP